MDDSRLRKFNVHSTLSQGLMTNVSVNKKSIANGGVKVEDTRRCRSKFMEVEV